MFKTSLTGVALAALLLPIAAIARTNNSDVLVTAEYRGEVRSMTVALADLDLRQDRAVNRAESRIRYAVKQVCDINSARELYEKRDYQACYDPTMSNARNDLDQRITTARAT
jgi:UrcA family protein